MSAVDLAALRKAVDDATGDPARFPRRGLIDSYHSAVVAAYEAGELARRAPSAQRVARCVVPDGQTPLDDKLNHRFLDVIKEGGTARDAGTGSPYHGHSLEHCLHAVGWVSRDLRLALEESRSRAAPSAPVEVEGLVAELLKADLGHEPGTLFTEAATALTSLQTALASKEAECEGLKARAEKAEAELALSDANAVRMTKAYDRHDKKMMECAEQAQAENARLTAALAESEAKLAAGLEACDLFDGPVSKSAFVNGQSTAAQQIRAALTARLAQPKGESQA